MQQNITQDTEKKTTPTDERLQINVSLTGEDAARFARYQTAQKLRQKGTAAYKLIVERLDQIEQEAAA
jgi:hypothetical protein